MKFRTDSNGSSIDNTGVSLRGTIQATLSQLTKVFGEPALGVPGDRILIEWVAEFEDGQVVTIYCWKIPDMPDADAVISWCIGGRSEAARDMVHSAFRSHFGLLAGAAA
jgi:hypothetical protein